ncbi:hypothetical protein J0H58_12630 [bacterium]|nr:hypothetical protein [bacterium]
MAALWRAGCCCSTLLAVEGDALDRQLLDPLDHPVTGPAPDAGDLLVVEPRRRGGIRPPAEQSPTDLVQPDGHLLAAEALPGPVPPPDLGHDRLGRPVLAALLPELVLALANLPPRLSAHGVGEVELGHVVEDRVVVLEVVVHSEVKDGDRPEPLPTQFADHVSRRRAVLSGHDRGSFLHPEAGVPFPQRHVALECQKLMGYD